MVVTRKTIKKTVLEILQETSPRVTQLDTQPLSVSDKPTLKSKTGNICWQSLVKSMERFREQNEELFSLMVQRFSDIYSRETGGYTDDCEPRWGSARSMMLGRGKRTQLDPGSMLKKAPKYIGEGEEAIDDDEIKQLATQITSVKDVLLRRHLINTIMAAEGQSGKELHAAINYVTKTLQNQLEK